MIDFHSHILPKIDDGAKDIDTALKMLKLTKNSGIDTIVSTSHCYPYNGNSDILSFLEKRTTSFNALQEYILKEKSDFPEILLGCEVHLTDNLSKCLDLSKLTIADTDYILLEMPSSEWNDCDFEEIYKITRLGLKPVIAHLDRYLNWEKKFPDLLSLNVLFQINAEAFISFRTRKKMLRLFMKDAIHIIGSDMHNLTTRPQNLASAYKIINKKFGVQYSEFLNKSCKAILNNKPVSVPHFEKMPLIKRILI